MDLRIQFEKECKLGIEPLYEDANKAKRERKEKEELFKSNFEMMVGLARKYRVPYIEVSSKEDINVDRLFGMCLYEYWYQTCVGARDRKYC